MNIRESLSRAIRKVANFTGTRLLATVASNLGLKVFGAALSFGAQIVLARLLGADSFGIYAWVLSIVNIVILLGILGFDTAAIRFVAAYRSTDAWERLQRFLRYSRRTVLSASTLVGILLIGCALALRHRGSDEQIRTVIIAGASLPLVAHFRQSMAVLQGFGKVIASTFLMTIFRPVVALAAFVALYFLLPSVGAPVALVSFVMGAGAATALSTMLIYRRVSSARESHGVSRGAEPGARVSILASEKRGWLMESLHFLLVSGFAVALFQIDVTMIGFLVGPSEAGIYSAASKIAEILVFALVAINGVIAPLISELHHRGDFAGLERIYILTARVAFLASLVGAIVIFIVGDHMLALFGNDFTAGTLPLKILAVGQLVNAFVGSTGVLVNMTGNQRDGAKILVGSAIANIGANWIMIPLFGITGAAIATASMRGLTDIAFAILVWKKLRLSPFARFL